MKAMSLVTKNLKQYQRELEAEDKKRMKAGETAAKVEGFSLRNVLKNELRQGRAGGRALSPKLSIIARKMKQTKAQRRTIRKPLSRLAVPIRYRTKKSNGKTLVQIGLVDPNRGAKLSKKWVRLGFTLQEGGMVEIGKKQRDRILKRGHQLARSQDQAARFFLLKRSTRRVQVPARNFIEPFWQANKAKAASNIAQNFERKMRGERI